MGTFAPVGTRNPPITPTVPDRSAGASPQNAGWIRTLERPGITPSTHAYRRLERLNGFNAGRQASVNDGAQRTARTLFTANPGRILGLICGDRAAGVRAAISSRHIEQSIFTGAHEMRARTSLWASMAIAASVGLAGCGGSSDNNEGTNPPESATPTPVDATAEIKLSKAQRAALKAEGILDDNGDTFTLENVGEGDNGVTRAGVTFTCASAYPCTVTVENSGGTIVAAAHSQRLPTGTLGGAAAGLAKDVVDTFAVLNDGSASAIRYDITGSRDRTSDDLTGDAADADPHITPTEFTGMGIGGAGVLPEDAETKAGLRSDFQANGSGLDEVTDGDSDPDTHEIADPGAKPNLTKGSTISVAVAPDGDRISASPDMAPAPDGWTMRTLFRDWGDTAGDNDGGFETGAIVVTDLGAGTPHPFDRKLSDKYVTANAQRMFELTALANGTATGPSTLATSVRINFADVTDVNNSADPAQWDNMVFDEDSLVPAQSQDLRIDVDETFRGTYFGAPGQFRCIDGGISDETCAIARSGDIISVYNDADDGDPTHSTGSWTFTPDPDATITVPDQDWIAYGAWLTTPDSAGDHRLGVLFNGMDTYEPAVNSFTAANNVGLRGSATYKGGATGVYVDGDDSGLFTADATLTAHFDRTSNGTDTPGSVDADTNDYSVSGRIDNFRGTDGVFLGEDTVATPNDPVAGGENDWVVLLGRNHFVGAADNENEGTPTGFGPRLDVSGGVTGSADGVRWDNGRWNGTFFGPSKDADGDPILPSGIAGQFWAETDDPDNALAANRGPVTAVVGTFGATKD